MPEIEFLLRGAHITLEALLKASGQVASGGQAKVMVQQGQVQVDGQPELRRACKLRPGQRVQVQGTTLLVVAAPV